MAINLSKGQKVDLTKGNPSLKVLNVALGWDANRFDTGSDFDLDVSVFMLNQFGKCKDETGFIFYNNPQHVTGAVIHSGDERTGAKEIDDEVIKVDLTKIPSDVEKLSFVITIHDAETRKQSFGNVTNAYVRVDNADTNVEVLKYDLDEEFSTETGVLVCEIYRYKGEWKFSAVGSGYRNGLAGFVRDYGLDA